MIRSRYLYSILTLLLLGKSYSQPVEKIKFKKNSALIYFFQVGPKRDTISKNQSDQFYLVVPDSLKMDISIHVENGQLQSTSNDSIVKLNYIKGFKYESIYSHKEINGMETPKGFEFRTLVNGTSAYSEGKIIIQIVSRRENSVLLENIFYLK